MSVGRLQKEKNVKIVYIGVQGPLSEALIERMIKEGNDMYVISDSLYKRKVKSVFQYRFYQVRPQKDAIQRVLRSIEPDWVIFAGTKLMDSALSGHFEEHAAEMILLSSVLRALSGMEKERNQVKMLLLSSTEVYGNHKTLLCPVSEKGILYAQEERMLELYAQQSGMDTVVLRVSQLFCENISEGGRDFLSEAFDTVLGVSDQRMAQELLLQPLHVSDLADAVKRVMDAGRQSVYNAAGSFTISAKELYELIENKLGVKMPQGGEAVVHKQVLAENDRLKRELEWTDFKQLKDSFAENRIVYEKKMTRQKKKKQFRMPIGLRRTIENLVVFGAFFAMDLLCETHALFSQMNWMLLYVVLVSLFLGIRQSAFAVMLASVAHLTIQNLSILEMTNFYSYAGSVLTIMEFVFLGLAVSYTMETLREEKRSLSLELELLRGDYQELRKIDEENVRIKNAYETRLLDSESGFPRLYQVVQKLMVLHPDRIFMEMMQVVSEMVHTDTVAVYRVSRKESSTYLRLINALQEMTGKSWNIKEHPGIQKTMQTGELYQGNVWKGEPAIVLPVMYQGKCTVLIRIDTLPYESQTLYYMNLLKTLSLMLTEAVGRALDYEALSRRQHYIEGTEILNLETFLEYVQLAKEKSRKHMAEYCIMELEGTGNLERAYCQIAPILRNSDYLGTDEEGTLYILLNNTGEADAENLGKRLSANQIRAAVTDVFDGVEPMQRVEKKGWA